jgi:hypothetical protein
MLPISLYAGNSAIRIALTLYPTPDAVVPTASGPVDSDVLRRRQVQLRINRRLLRLVGLIRLLA